MKRKIACLALAAVMVLGSMSGCKKSTSSTASTTSPNAPVTVHIFMGSPEITDAVNTSIAEYKKVKPNVTIQLQVLQSDLNTVLKSKIASGDIPDVFQTTNGPELKEYSEYSADISNMPAVKALASNIKSSMSYNNQVQGLPLKVDEFGILYNKTMFANAGITSTPKTFSELEAACKKLQAKGYTPFANGYKEWWVFKHVMQHFVGAANPTDVPGTVDKFLKGTTTFSANPVMNNYFKFVDLSVKYGAAKPLDTDYNGEVTAIGGGKAAMVTGIGSFAEANILKIDPSIKLGIMAYPVSEDASQANLISGASQCLRFNKDSKSLTAAEDFYNWLFTSEYGKKTWFPKVAQLIAPTTDAVTPEGLSIPTDFAAQTTKDKVPLLDSAINYSDDSFHQKLGETMQAYIAKSKSQDQCITEIQKYWTQLGTPKE